MRKNIFESAPQCIFENNMVWLQYDNQEFITLFSGEEIAKEITLIRDDAVDKINRNIERINKFVNNKVNFFIDLSHKINQFKADDFQLTHISYRSLERLDHVDKI